MIQILHVDDEMVEHKLLMHNLKQVTNKIELHWLDSAAEALKLVEKKKFDCIIGDYQMPGMNGLEFLLKLNEQENVIPFIFLAGQGNEKLAAEALRTGASDYYTKAEGFAHYERLFNSIARHVESARYRQDQHLAEILLRENEERFRTFVEQSVSAVEIYEPDRKMIIVNNAWARFWNLKKEDVADFNIFDDPQCEKTGLTLAFREAQKGRSLIIPETKYDLETSGFQDGRLGGLPQEYIQ